MLRLIFLNYKFNSVTDLQLITSDRGGIWFGVYEIFENDCEMARKINTYTRHTYTQTKDCARLGYTLLIKYLSKACIHETKFMQSFDIEFNCVGY